MLIVTSNGVPGHRVEAVLGTVIGTSIRSTDLGGALRGLGGGDRDELDHTSRVSRHEALDAVWRECQRRGANAVVALKFDTAEIGGRATEVCAYGTAVVVTPLAEGEPGATPQSIAIAAQPVNPEGNWPKMEGDRGRPAEGTRPQAAEAAPAGQASPVGQPSPALQASPAVPAAPRTAPERRSDDPRWQPTADAPTTDFPAVGVPQAGTRGKDGQGSWLDLPPR
ncbi:YbjQ family protein [Mariniluteicoccus flavus]